MARQLGPDVLPDDLLNLPKYTTLARLLIDGTPGRPFSLRTLPPPGHELAPRADVVRRTSRQRYGRSLVQVEQGVAQAFD